MLLTWLPSDGDRLTNYTISYTYEGRCSGIAESYALEMVTSTNCIIEGLEEFSIYTVTVMAARGDEVTEINCTVITPPAGMISVLAPFVIHSTLLVHSPFCSTDKCGKHIQYIHKHNSGMEPSSLYPSEW